MTTDVENEELNIGIFLRERNNLRIDFNPLSLHNDDNYHIVVTCELIAFLSIGLNKGGFTRSRIT